MPTERITADLVKAMTKGETLWDSEVRGFGIRFRARDRIYLLKVRVRGVQRVLTIGRHGRGAFGPESARREAQRLVGLIRDGKDPATERDKERSSPTVALFAERFTREYSAVHHKPRSQAEAKGLIRRYIVPALGTLKLRDVNKADVAKLHSGLFGTPIAANRALAVLSTMLGWAERVGERDDGTNPCRHVDRFPEKARETMLSPAELGRLGDALNRAAEPWTAEDAAQWRRQCEAQAEAENLTAKEKAAWIDARQPSRTTAEDWRAIAGLRLLIFTGARLSEVLTLRWDWIDAAAGVARLPDSKTGAKNLYLPPPALAVLTTLRRFAGNPHVLPGDRGAGAFVGIEKPWQRVRALAGLPTLRIHDLRHAFASTAVAAGDSLFVIGKLLGHRNTSTTQRYAHLASDPAKAVADRTGERLRAMLAGEIGEVVKLPARRPR